jgi:hypothetical protein
MNYMEFGRVVDLAYFSHIREGRFWIRIVVDERGVRSMLNPIQKGRYQKGFSIIESSFRVEGMDPSGDVIYEEAKAKVLSGDMTPQEALSFVVQRTVNHHKKVLAAAAS